MIKPKPVSFEMADPARLSEEWRLREIHAAAPVLEPDARRSPVTHTSGNRFSKTEPVPFTFRKLS